MFGGLRKKLQEAVKKVSKAVAEDRELPKEMQKEELPLLRKEHEETREKAGLGEEIAEMEKEAKDVLQDFEAPKRTPFHEEPEKKAEKYPLDELKEKEIGIVKEKESLDRLASSIREDEKTPRPETRIKDFERREIAIEEAREEKKEKGFLGGLIRKVSEKKLEGKDVDKVVKELHLTLLENDVSMETADRICDDLKKELTGKSVPRAKIEDAISDALRSSMLDVLTQERVDIEKLVKEKHGEPFLVMFLGFNGTGKTTTLSKLASRFRDYNPILAAGDTFRAASIEQLEEHGRRLGLKVIKHTYGSDSAAVIFDSMKHAKASGNKLVLADTAGRSHANSNLMDELKKICRVNKPDLKILVLDSLTGNDIYDQVRLFDEAVGIDGIILSKADVYDRGGAALSAAHTSKKPILFLGTGQEYSDLKEFDPEEIVSNLLD